VVEAGEVLAVIRLPELDQQVDRARAALSSPGELAAVGGDGPTVPHFGSRRLGQPPELGHRSAHRGRASRRLDAAAAALDEAEQRRSYVVVTAPFDGTVTNRNIEAGDLVSADNAQTKPLFVVAGLTCCVSG
jgi:membrane fusion protein (multidrug efflux system)